MEGSVLSFLKAEWKVNNTGSAHWASSYYYYKFAQTIVWVLIVLVPFFFFLILYLYDKFLVNYEIQVNVLWHDGRYIPLDVQSGFNHWKKSCVTMETF